MNEENKIYTAADFGRYHSGAMSPAEMHALERAALEDPFLEEALDGYVNTQNAGSDIEELETRLAEKREKKNIFFISSVAQNKWWRIAALFIVIAGAGYIFYRANNFNKENSLVRNEVQQEPLKKQNVSPVITDSVANKNDMAFENQQSSKREQKERAALPVKPLFEKKVIVPKKNTASAIAQNSFDKSKDYQYSDSSVAKISSGESDSTTLKGYVLAGKVTDHTGAPVPFAAISDQGRRRATVADASGNFTIYSGDSSMFAAATATGFESKKIKLKKDSVNTIVMNKNNAELTTVVVTTANGVSKRLKKNNPPSNALAEKKVVGVQISTAGLHPVDGLQKFEQYLKDSAVAVFDENNQPATGEVVLSFTINDEGRPINIEVRQSSCEACEEEATRLLENGPAWGGKKNEHGNVTIKF